MPGNVIILTSDWLDHIISFGILLCYWLMCS